MKAAIKKLRQLKAKRIFVQYPEGIKLRMQEIVKELEKEGFAVVLCIEQCFGSCDIRDNEAIAVGCDAILHIGHEDFGVESKLPVVFWEYFIDSNPIPILEKEFEKINNYKKIGLATSIQFVNSIPIVKKFLEEKGKEVFVHKALQHEGQVLGCRLEAAKAIENEVDCFLCVTAGKFYGLGLILSTSKPVFCLDLERKEIYSLDDMKKKIVKIIAWNKVQLKDAKRIGLLVSWKKGQFKPKVFDVKKKLQGEGKEVFVLVMDEITPEKLEGLKLDAAINFACPRLGIDDIDRFKMPIINWDQLNE